MLIFIECQSYRIGALSWHIEWAPRAINMPHHPTIKQDIIRDCIYEIDI